MGKKILIAEPLELLRIGLRTIFLGDPRISNVYEVMTYEALKSKLPSCELDLIVVRQSLMGDLSLFPKEKVVILAAQLDVKMLQAACKYGARGYLLDTVSAELLLTTLQAPCGAFLIDPVLAPRIMEYFSYNEEFNYDLLTPREREIMGLLREGVDSSSIVKNLHITNSTLKTHLKNINRKRTTKPLITEKAS